MAELALLSFSEPFIINIHQYIKIEMIYSERSNTYERIIQLKISLNISLNIFACEEFCLFSMVLK